LKLENRKALKALCNRVPWRGIHEEAGSPPKFMSPTPYLGKASWGTYLLLEDENSQGYVLCEPGCMPMPPQSL